MRAADLGIACDDDITTPARFVDQLRRKFGSDTTGARAALRWAGDQLAGIDPEEIRDMRTSAGFGASRDRRAKDDIDEEDPGEPIHYLVRDPEAMRAFMEAEPEAHDRIRRFVRDRKLRGGRDRRLNGDDPPPTPGTPIVGGGMHPFGERSGGGGHEAYDTVMACRAEIVRIRQAQDGKPGPPGPDVSFSRMFPGVRRIQTGGF
jgi:hypothetical protein